eukprot:gene18960-6308_t
MKTEDYGLPDVVYHFAKLNDENGLLSTMYRCDKCDYDLCNVVFHPRTANHTKTFFPSYDMKIVSPALKFPKTVLKTKDDTSQILK